MSDPTLMTDAATTTEGAPASSTAAPAAAPAQAGADASAAQPQQAPQGSAPQDGSQPAGGEPKGDQGAPQADQPAGAPEKYEFAAPENVTFDDQTLQAYSEVARELDMPQEAAQKILDKVAPIMAQRQVEVLNTLNTQWVEGVRADKEIGGDKLQENLAVAKKAMDTFGTPELRTLLNESRLGNHPEIIRAFYRAGKAISEDRFVPGSTGGAPRANRDAAKSLYPNQ